MNMEAVRVRISSGHKVGLITVGVFEIIIGLASIGASATTITFTLWQYWSCYQYVYDYSHHYPYPPYYSHCFYNWLYRFSVTSQGIWTGCLVIISASLNIRLATNPTKQMGSISGGFSILSFILTILMITLESFAVADGYYNSYYGSFYYDYIIWALHCALLSFAAALFTLTLTNMIISYAVIGCPGCCRTSTAVVPMTFYNDAHPMTAHPIATVAVPQPISTPQQMQVGQQIPNLTNSGLYQPAPHRSSLLAIPEPHAHQAFKREPTLIAQMQNQVPTVQTQPSFHPEKTQDGTAVIPEQPQNSETAGVSNDGNANLVSPQETLME